MHASCGLRLGLNSKPELIKLCQTLDNSPGTADITAMAHYELGRAYRNKGDDHRAFTHLKKAFFADSTVETYRLSGCSLYLLLKDNPDIDAKDSGLRTVLATARKDWDRKLFAECRPHTKDKPSAAAAPARMLIRFYQKQISPAIGSRCSLHPSCSHYAMQALKAHGLIGIGIMSDRFIREPDVVAAQKKPVKINGHIKYSDPLSDHDQWMKK
jgi:putative component of membrane protein insertase Oxa1/YidC/SpoIIIJ protein YidD